MPSVSKERTLRSIHLTEQSVKVTAAEAPERTAAAMGGRNPKRNMDSDG
jgi:hypothetical protein